MSTTEVDLDVGDQVNNTSNKLSAMQLSQVLSAPYDIEDLPPIERFRGRQHLAVSNLTMAGWCEVQYD